MLEIKNLTVTVQDRKEPIVRNFNLVIKDGEIHVLMGPNGAGKSSVAHAMMGNPKYKTTGSIFFNKEEISKLRPNERAQRGLFLAFQNPEEIEGISLSVLLRKAHSSITGEKQTMDEMIALQKKIDEKSNRLGLGDEFVRRPVNVGFSGGEKKRSEILQAVILQPKLLILDEIDSGLDIDGLKLISNELKKLIDGKRSFLIITHNTRILKYIKPKFVHVMINGQIVKSGTPKLAEEIEKKGYGWVKEN
jgi:Fe-S cluster assembly ATP-binding protein